MPKDTKTLGNSKARACESLGFVHKKGCARVLTQPRSLFFFAGIAWHKKHTPRSEYPTSVSYKKGYKIHTGYWILTWYQARE